MKKFNLALFAALCISGVATANCSAGYNIPDSTLNNPVGGYEAPFRETEYNTVVDSRNNLIQAPRSQKEASILPIDQPMGGDQPQMMRKPNEVKPIQGPAGRG